MYFALALLAVIVTAVVPGRELSPRVPATLERILSKVVVVPLAVVTLVIAQHAYLKLLLDATYHQHPMRHFMAAMPIRFISGLSANNLSELYRTGFALLVLLETCALIALYFGLARPTRTNIMIVLAGTLFACADAIAAKAATSADMYAYVGYMLLGVHAYQPQATAFPGDYSLINVWWHTPLVSAAYGPLWLAIADAAGTFGHSLLTKIVVLRILGVFALLGTAGTLAALGVPPRIVALVALNPALIFEFVANVHNDLFAVLLLLVARFATMRGSMRVAIGFAAGASLVKLPFLLFAALAFVPINSLVRRVRAYGLALAIGLSVSGVLGGWAYLAALQRAANESTAGHAISIFTGASAILKIVAAAAVALAFGSGLFVEGCAWTLPLLSALLHPWYLCWTIPYAVESQQMLRNVAIALPIVMLIADGALGDGTLIRVIAGLAYVSFALALAHRLIVRAPLRESRI